MSDNFKYLDGFGTRYKLFPDGRIISSATGKEVKCQIRGNSKNITLYNGSKYIGFTISKLLELHFGIKRHKNHKVKSLDGEQWAPIPSYEDSYMISTHGRVKAIDVPYVGERLLKITTHKRGHLTVSLSVNNQKESFVVCNLMGRVFLPNLHKRKMVIHLDGDKKHNHVSNIKWVHNSEAQKLAIDLGLKPILWGEENPTSVAVKQYSADGMTFIKRWGCMNDVERQLKIPHSNISKVCRGKRNTAGGYFWEYEIE